MQAVRAFPDRVFGFVFLNPLRRDASLEELNRCVRDGPLVGVKLVLSTRCNSTLLDPIVERSTALRAVILQHTWLKTGGNLPGESTPQDLAELAARHPRARFIAAHAGGNWEIGIPALKGVRNVAIDTSGIDPTAGFLETAVRELGPERVVYGSDAAVRSFASQLGKVMGADLSAATRGLVLCGNFKRLLKPILDAKGLRA
jgi:predicted TIM-barrel fold metal-dependent hydrolase